MGKDLTELEIQELWLQGKRFLAKEQLPILTRSYQAWLELARSTLIARGPENDSKGQE